MLSANTALWPAEVILSKWDYIVRLLLIPLQIKLPVKYEIMLPTKISDGCENIPGMNWAPSPTAVCCQLSALWQQCLWFWQNPFVRLCLTLLLMPTSSPLLSIHTAQMTSLVGASSMACKIQVHGNDYFLRSTQQQETQLGVELCLLNHKWACKSPTHTNFHQTAQPG